YRVRYSVPGNIPGPDADPAPEVGSVGVGGEDLRAGVGRVGPHLGRGTRSAARKDLRRRQRAAVGHHPILQSLDPKPHARRGGRGPPEQGGEAVAEGQEAGEEGEGGEPTTDARRVRHGRILRWL